MSLRAPPAGGVRLRAAGRDRGAEVPLASNLTDRVNAEVRADSAAQAPGRRRLRGRPARTSRPAPSRWPTQAAARLGGRVFVVDGRGRLLADSSDAAELGHLYATDDRPELLEALGGEIGQGTHHRTCEDLLHRGARSCATGARSARSRSSRPRARSTTRSAATARAGRDRRARTRARPRRRLDPGRVDLPADRRAGGRRPAHGGRRPAARAEPGGSSEQVEVARASTRWPTGSRPCSSPSAPSSPTPPTSSALP